ncbi:uridine kinase [Streptomyces sp. Da 82-17]|uniref:uridine kinase family protein n=1 Tax=Streptomyces sp. Da 82-17 TaxID=3377116 RepID=UPI0038D3837C
MNDHPEPIDLSGPPSLPERTDLPGPSGRPELARLARALRALPPSCGPVRLVAVDGHAGSGKSTFAERLATVLGGAPVLALDDVRSHAELFDWTERFERQVLTPLSRGRTARVPAYDWNARRFDAEMLLPAAPVVLVEGVGAGRRELRPWLAWLCWMDLAHDDAWARGRRRDGAAQREFWDGWERAEHRHFAEDPTRPRADTLVRQRPEGYVLLPGRGETPPSPQAITHGDESSAVR